MAGTKQPEDEESLAVVLDLFPAKGRPSRRVVAVARDMKQGQAAIPWPPAPPDDAPPSAA